MYTQYITRIMHCPKCDHSWYAKLTKEYGIENFDQDNETICNKCGNEGEVGEVVTERDYKEAV